MRHLAFPQGTSILRFLPFRPCSIVSLAFSKYLPRFRA